MRLTDVVTAEDIYKWITHLMNQGKSPHDIAIEIFPHSDKKLCDLRDMLVNFGFPKGETGAILQFLDEAMIKRAKEPMENG